MDAKKEHIKKIFYFSSKIRRKTHPQDQTERTGELFLFQTQGKHHKMFLAACNSRWIAQNK